MRYLEFVFFTVFVGSWLKASDKSCLEIYYGLEGQSEFAKAYQCFESEENFEMLVIMNLNGEGVQQDFQAAKALFEKNIKANNPTLKSPLLKLISERVENSKKKWERIDFCKDFASNTLQLNECAAVEEGLVRLNVEKTIAQVKRGLGASEQIQVDQLHGVFLKLCEADSQRVYQENIDGSIRNMAAMEQEKYLFRHYEGNIKKWIEKRNFPKGLSLKVADQKLNAVYQDKIRESDKLYDERLNSSKLKEYTEQYAENKKRYRSLIKDAQLQWIKYRDSWKKLVESLNKDKNPLVVGDAVIAALTDQRAQELQYDSLVGN